MDPKQVDVDFTRKQLEQHGLGATMSFGLDASTDISSNDPEKTKRGQQRLEEYIYLCRDIGATHLCGILHSAFQKYAVPTTADGRRALGRGAAPGGRDRGQEQHHARALRS